MVREIAVNVTAKRPNPEDWTDASGAGLILNRDRATVYDYVRRGIITRYALGALPDDPAGRPIFWVPELREVAAALERVSPR